MEVREMLFEIIMPIAKQDYEIAAKNIPQLLCCLEPKRITIIACDEVGRSLANDFSESDNIRYINENDVFNGMTFTNIKSYLKKYNSESRTGWYFQQFLKMGYAFLCDEEYYMSWDADTIPIKKCNMFINERPVFDTKTEYHKPYFSTIKKLLGIDKQIARSYISEHMIFKKSIMLELINKIQYYKRNDWFYNILEAIEESDLMNSGFSEFETYGTYVEKYYKGLYAYRDINTIRNGKCLFKGLPAEEVLEWLSKDYYAISFEKDDKEILSGALAENNFIRTLFPPVYTYKSARII